MEKSRREQTAQTIIRIGIIGTGRIAGRMVQELKDTTAAGEWTAPSGEALPAVPVLKVIYNPNREHAEQFLAGLKNKDEANDRNTDQTTGQATDQTAGQMADQTAATDELSVLKASSDAVYIASPHETHYRYAREMLLAGKHVLCEKPMALKAAEVRELYRIAEEKGLVLMEALKTSYAPGFLEIIKTAESGRIGRIVDVEAAFTKLSPTNTREIQDEIYGGSLTELGAYAMLPVFRLLGTDYRDLRFRSIPWLNGVDAYTRAEFDYGDAFGTAKTGLLAKSEGQLLITGTRGYILARSPWWLTKHYEICFEDTRKNESYDCEFKRSGLQYEMAELVLRIMGRAKALWVGVTAEESIANASVMEQFLRMRKHGTV